MRLLERWIVGDIEVLRSVFEAKSKVTLALLEEGNLKYQRDFDGKDIIGSAKNIEGRGSRIDEFIGSKMCVVTAVMYTPSWLRSKSTHKEYEVQIALYDRSFSETRTGKEVIELPDKGLYMNIVGWGTTPVALRCGCDNFEFVWAPTLLELGGLYGGRIRVYDPDAYLQQKAKSGFEKDTEVRFYGGGRRKKEVEQDIRDRYTKLKMDRERRGPRKSAVSPYPGACVHIWGLIWSMANDGWIE